MAIVDSEFLVLGAGIAGASIGHWLAPCAQTVLLERESQPGYHSTGRSAAMVIDSYGSAQVRALTSASRAFFELPPEGFTEVPLLASRAVMMLAKFGQEALLDEHLAVVRSISSGAPRLSAREACALVPVLRTEQILGAVLDPTASDIDVHALHQGFLRGIRRSGGRVICGEEAIAIERAGSGWRIESRANTYRCAVLINAAGAWCDQVAQLAGVEAIGLVPKRRSCFLFPAPPGLSAAGWPMCGTLDESWYMKPNAGALLGSPANADPTEPQDVQADEFDIALGIHNIQEMTTLEIRRPTSTWAGLRSFVSDGGLVGGYDAKASNFFWVAGQGGYGIQTAPAMGEVCASLVLGRSPPDRIAAFGVAKAGLDPARISRGREP